RTRHRLIQLRDPEALNDVLLLLRVSDRATIVLDRDASAFIFCLLCHLSIFDFRIAIFDLAIAVRVLTIANRKSAIANYMSSSTALPRSRATSIGSFIRIRPLNVARTTL